MKRQKTVITIIMFSLVASLVCLGIWCYATFFRYQSDIDLLISDGKRVEGELPENVRSVATALDIEDTDVSYHARLLSKCRGTKDLRPLEIAAYRVTWKALLPLLANKSERLSLYTSLMPFDGGVGLKFGAQRYFAKRPDELTTDEVLILLARSNNPIYFRDDTHLADLEDEVRFLREKYETQR